MPPLPQALLAVVLLSVTIAVTAAPPTSVKTVSTKPSSFREHAKSVADKKRLRRSKRQVVYNQAMNDGDNDDDEDQYSEEALIRQQLQQLSDAELAALADIVRDEMTRYESPQLMTVPQYDIVEIPDEMLDESLIEPYPRDRRAAMAVDWAAAPEQLEEPQYIVVPEEAVVDALNDEQDEMELRDRIAEIAQILNERAARRYSRLY